MDVLFCEHWDTENLFLDLGPSLVELGENCSKLKCLEIFSSKSVTEIVFETQAFMQLRSVPSLRTLRVMYQDSVLLFLPILLRHHESISEVVLWHRSHWFDSIHSVEIQTIVETTASLFPNVSIVLEEFVPRH